MVEKIGMRPPDPGRNGLKRHGLWAGLDQQVTSSLKRDSPAFLGRQSFTSY